MQITRYHKKRMALIAIGLVAFYIFIMSGYNKYQIEGIIKNTKPEDVWEYVADFSKMRVLNPTILDFKITADAGTYDHWTYSVMYREKLSHWPHWISIGYAHFAVRKVPKSEGQILIVDSKHKTCFLSGFYCLYSEGEFQFTSINEKDTYCVENISYECPPLMGRLCKREVEYQRKAIMHNLTIHFSKH